MFLEKLLFLNKNTLKQTPEFKSFRLKDVNPLGGTTKIRTIFSPNNAMRQVHKIFIRFLRSLALNLSCAKGATSGSSTKKNVLVHRINRYFYLLDIKNAFPSVDGKRLAEIIAGSSELLRGKKDEIFAFLKAYCLSDAHGLLVGAPASPDLFNIYAACLVDEKLSEFSKKHGITYTRYLDDLTFSSPRKIGKRKRKEIRKIVEGAGFVISHRKSAVYDLKRGPIEINGIGLEFGGRIFLPRHYLSKIRGLLHRAIQNGDIPKSTINGLMGVFWSATEKRKLNRSEEKILELYKEYLRQR